MRRFLAIAILSGVLVVSARSEDGFRAGTAKRIITPNPLLPVSGGFGPTRPVTQKQGELTTRALVLQRNDIRVAFVSVDLLGFPSALGNRVRERVHGIPAENILIAATHNHSGPDSYAFPDGQGGHTGDLKYLEDVCAKTAEAIQSAIDSLAPAKLRVATAEANGKIAYNYYAPDLYDRRMNVVQLATPDDKPIATLVNYAIHPEVIGPDVGILSPDLVGPLCERLETQAGGMAIFINSAQGGMVTADNRNLDRPADAQRGYWHDDRTWEECLRIGHTMADEAQRIVKNAAWQASPNLYCTAIDVTFPVESDALWQVVLHSPLGYPKAADHKVTSRVNLVNLGTAQILTIPGEALPNIGFYLKRKMKGKQNLLFGLTNDAFGYMLTRVDFHSFPRYDYVSRVSLGEETGEIYIKNALDLISRCPVPDSQ